MQRFLSTLGLVAVLAVTAPPPAAAQHAHTPVFDGEWEVTFASQMGEQTFTMILAVEDGAITGMSSTSMGEMPVEGTQDGAKLDFTIDLVAPDHEVMLVFEGELEGDVASGSVDIMGEVFTWTGKRVETHE